MSSRNQEQSSDWRVIGGSIQGSAHIRECKPKQDQICWWPEPGEGLPLVLVVADGHGGESHFRSHIGASFAVKTAIDVLVKFAERTKNEADLKLAKQRAEQELPKVIYNGWQIAIADELCTNPLTQEELALVEKLRGAARRRHVTLHPVLAYGTTLLSVLITDKYILYLQLGDGDILVVDEKDEVRKAISPNEELLGDEVFSLSLSNAWKDFSVSFESLARDDLPALILMSTDGYHNSFVDEDAFLRVGIDYHRMIREKGIDAVAAQLEGWLSTTSARGSGDDISLGLVCRTDTLPKPIDKAVTEKVEVTNISTSAEKDEDTVETRQASEIARPDPADNTKRQNE